MHAFESARRGDQGKRPESNTRGTSNDSKNNFKSQWRLHWSVDEQETYFSPSITSRLPESNAMAEMQRVLMDPAGRTRQPP